MRLWVRISLVIAGVAALTMAGGAIYVDHFVETLPERIEAQREREKELRASRLKAEREANPTGTTGSELLLLGLEGNQVACTMGIASRRFILFPFRVVQFPTSCDAPPFRGSILWISSN